MRRWILYGLVICAVCLLGITPFRGTDVAELSPVALIRVSKSGDDFVIETDTGGRGAGPDAQSALQNLKDTTPGTVFLETADYLLVAPDCVAFAQSLYGILRPSCAVCICRDKPNLESAAVFLKAHKPLLSLHELKQGNTGLPELKIQGEWMELVSQ